MAINVSVQYNGGLLPDPILLTQCYYHHDSGNTRLKAMKRVYICSLLSHLNVLTSFPLTGGCSEGLGAFILFFKQAVILFYFAAGTFIPHDLPSLQTGSDACVHPTAPFVRPGVYTRKPYRGDNRVQRTRWSERGRDRSRGREWGREW